LLSALGWAAPLRYAGVIVYPTVPLALPCLILAARRYKSDREAAAVQPNLHSDNPHTAPRHPAWR